MTGGARAGAQGGASGRNQAYALLALAALLWAGNFVLARAVRSHVPPVALGFWRWTGALAVLLPLSAHRLRADRRALLRSWRIVVALGVLGIGSFNMLVYVGVRSTTATNALLLNSACPAFIVAIAFAIGVARPTFRQLGGIAVSLLGVLAIVSRGQPGALLALAFSRGDLWVLAAQLVWASYTVLLSWRPRDVDARSLLTATVAIGVAWMSPFYAWELLGGAHLALDAITIGSLLYVALLASVAAYFCWTHGVGRLDASRAGVFMHLIPAFGAVLAYAFLGEAFRAYHAAGIGLILGGVYLAGTVRGGPAMTASAATTTGASP